MTQINIFSIVKYPSLFYTTKNKTFIYTYITTENFTTLQKKKISKNTHENNKYFGKQIRFSV
jgi:hypothetical protein